MKFEEVRPKHVKDMVAKLRAAKKAPRTVRNVYWTLKAMYRAAQIDDVASPSYTPCILTKNELGKLADAKSNWRTTAKFEREEFEWLISDARIPKDRRVMYALLGLGMLRHGEVAGLRWGNYHQPNGADIKPLGRLVIATSYDTGRTKTRVERWMPVHPVLAAMLAEWRLAGWPREFGRAPGPDDLIVPHTKPMNRGPRVEFGGMRSDHDTYKRLHIDCDAVGLRHRRVHDLRRTGITLAREDGADKDVLRFCTHGRAGGHHGRVHVARLVEALRAGRAHRGEAARWHPWDRCSGTRREHWPRVIQTRVRVGQVVGQVLASARRC